MNTELTNVFYCMDCDLISQDTGATSPCPNCKKTLSAVGWFETVKP